MNLNYIVDCIYNYFLDGAAKTQLVLEENLRNTSNKDLSDLTNATILVKYSFAPLYF